MGGHLSTRIQRNPICLPRPPFPLSLSGGLTYQQFDVGHVKGPVLHLLHKPQLQENLDCPLHGADLLAGDGGDHLRGVGDALVKLKPPAVFQ